MKTRSFTAAMLAAMGLAAGSGPAAAQPRANCVALGTPNPSLTYTYIRTERGASVEFATQWEEVTPTGSRQRTTRAGRGGGSSNNVSRHRIENDVSIIQETVQNGSRRRRPVHEHDHVRARRGGRSVRPRVRRPLVAHRVGHRH